MDWSWLLGHISVNKDLELVLQARELLEELRDSGSKTQMWTRREGKICFIYSKSSAAFLIQDFSYCWVAAPKHTKPELWVIFQPFSCVFQWVNSGFVRSVDWFILTRGFNIRRRGWVYSLYPQLQQKRRGCFINALHYSKQQKYIPTPLL